MSRKPRWEVYRVGRYTHVVSPEPWVVELRFEPTIQDIKDAVVHLHRRLHKDAQ